MSWKAGKRIIVWGIVSGLATIAGILNDVPDLIKWAVENVPVGLTGPELLWVAAGLCHMGYRRLVAQPQTFRSPRMGWGRG